MVAVNLPRPVGIDPLRDQLDRIERKLDELLRMPESSTYCTGGSPNGAAGCDCIYHRRQRKADGY